MLRWDYAGIILLGLVTASAASAGVPFGVPASPAPATTLPTTPVVVFGQDARRTVQDFAGENNLNEKDLTRAHAASGLVRCGNAHGAGQLTLADDVVTTAAHVFYDENGLPRAPVCNFEVTVNGTELHVPVDWSSVRAGSTKPYDAEVTRDWAVARLQHGVIGAKPYALASAVHAEEPMTFVSRGHLDWGGAKKLSMQNCTLHDKLSDGAEGNREFSFDCDTGDGASGGALMFDHDMTRIGAILVGWRSNRPFAAVPFSAKHYNFAVTIEGSFRQAVYAAANKLLVQR